MHVASRRLSGETEAEIRAGFARLFDALGVMIDAADPIRLMVFPEMDAASDVPEITESCWENSRQIAGERDVLLCAHGR